MTEAAPLAYRPDDAVAVELTGIDGSPLFNDDGSPMTWSVFGADSDNGVKAKKDDATQSYNRASRGIAFSADIQQAAKDNYLLKLTAGWNLTPSKLIPGVDPGVGEGLVEFSPAAALAVIRNPKLTMIRDQPDAAIAERARFMKASA